MAVWTTERYLCFITDCELVAKGWYEKRYANPTGEDADVWHKIGTLMLSRRHQDISVIWTHSHMSGKDIYEGRAIRQLVIGNLLADEFAGYAAACARLPQSVRARVLLHERKAYLIRMRLLRAGLDSMRASQMEEIEAKKRAREVPPPPPPPPPPCAAAASALMSRHRLAECRRRCLRCHGSATLATADEFRASDCPELYNVDGVILTPKT